MWQRNEYFSEFVYDEIILANKVPIEDNQIVDYLIKGISDENLKDQRRMQQFFKVETLLSAFEKITLNVKKKFRR